MCLLVSCLQLRLPMVVVAADRVASDDIDDEVETDPGHADPVVLVRFVVDHQLTVSERAAMIQGMVSQNFPVVVTMVRAIAHPTGVVQMK